MSISLRADSGGTSGAVQINGTDVLTVASDGTLTTTASPSPGDNSLKLATTAFVAANGGGAGRLVNIQRFSTAGTFTYTRTAGATWGIVAITGAGGGGAGSQATAAGQLSLGGFGGNGAYAEYLIDTLPSSCSLIVGAAGSQGAAGGHGGAGGLSSFGNVGSIFISVSGGSMAYSVGAYSPTFPVRYGRYYGSPTIQAANWSKILKLNRGSQALLGILLDINDEYLGNGSFFLETPYLSTRLSDTDPCAGVGGSGITSLNGQAAKAAPTHSAGRAGNGVIIVYEYA